MTEIDTKVEDDNTDTCQVAIRFNAEGKNNAYDHRVNGVTKVVTVEGRVFVIKCRNGQRLLVPIDKVRMLTISPDNLV